MAIKRIGQVMIDHGFITPEQLDILLEKQKEHRHELIGQLAISMGLITDEQLVEVLADHLNVPAYNLAETDIRAEVIAIITPTMADVYKIIPVSLEGNVLTIVMAQPQQLQVIDELRTLLGYDIRPAVASEADINKAYAKYYEAATTDTMELVLADIEQDAELNKAIQAANSMDETIDLTGAQAMAESAPVRKLLNMVLLMAIRDRASDIHFEPFENEFKIRVRADGALYEMVPPPKHLAMALTTRIKVMANLDIAERRLPQDGRIELSVGGHPVDLRVSILPTMFGESAVLRILDRSVILLDLDNVGMDPGILLDFRKLIRIPNGIILVTGPTGSGKTTTLYAALNELNVIEEKLMTTEDPVEYDIDGIIQIPVDSSIGNTFARCLRSILRQDPDKILVGEIRDLETAEIAVQSSLTGHLVFSTLHTNDAPSTVTRLRDMGIPPFLLTATLEAVLGQRLVRRICTDCKEETMPSQEQLVSLDLGPDEILGKKFYHGRGCNTCNGSGLKGRTAIHELLMMNDRLRDVINEGASTEKIRDVALQSGLRPLRESGLTKIFSGMTTIDEVIRETVID
ncbi:MAG: Flp pilus assembly complex ATPase component TadA [Thermoguttaceae bacterium]|nr:Flp pilus assembly complex ATPase component TadA [Thermoguttaceae bacterium]